MPQSGGSTAASWCQGVLGSDEIGFDNAISHVDPSGHFFACPQTMERYSTEFYEPIVHFFGVKPKDKGSRKGLPIKLNLLSPNP